MSDLKNYVRSDDQKELKAEQVSQTIDRVMTLVGKQVRKMVKRFDVEVAEDLPAVKINPGKIEQVLINMVINAGQAADKDDSWVRISADSRNSSTSKCPGEFSRMRLATVATRTLRLSTRPRSGTETRSPIQRSKSWPSPKPEKSVSR